MRGDARDVAQLRLASLELDDLVVGARQHAMRGREHQVARECRAAAEISARTDDQYHRARRSNPARRPRRRRSPQRGATRRRRQARARARMAQHESGRAGVDYSAIASVPTQVVADLQRSHSCLPFYGSPAVGTSFLCRRIRNIERQSVAHLFTARTMRPIRRARKEASARRRSAALIRNHETIGRLLLLLGRIALRRRSRPYPWRCRSRSGPAFAGMPVFFCCIAGFAAGTGRAALLQSPSTAASRCSSVSLVRRLVGRHAAAVGAAVAGAVPARRQGRSSPPRTTRPKSASSPSTSDVSSRCLLGAFDCSASRPRALATATRDIAHGSSFHLTRA